LKLTRVAARWRNAPLGAPIHAVYWIFPAGTRDRLETCIIVTQM